MGNENYISKQLLRQKKAAFTSKSKNNITAQPVKKYTQVKHLTIG
jgi:hypothetical protein